MRDRFFPVQLTINSVSDSGFTLNLSGLDVPPIHAGLWLTAMDPQTGREYRVAGNIRATGRQAYLSLGDGRQMFLDLNPGWNHDGRSNKRTVLVERNSIGIGPLFET